LSHTNGQRLSFGGDDGRRGGSYRVSVVIVGIVYVADLLLLIIIIVILIVLAVGTGGLGLGLGFGIRVRDGRRSRTDG
jgi:hypothetical protein